MKEILIGILVAITFPVWMALIAVIGVVMLLHNTGKAAIELVEEIKSW